jgi:hypothetical protein
LTGPLPTRTNPGCSRTRKRPTRNSSGEAPRASTSRISVVEPPCSPARARYLTDVQATPPGQAEPGTSLVEASAPKAWPKPSIKGMSPSPGALAPPTRQSSYVLFSDRPKREIRMCRISEFRPLVASSLPRDPWLRCLAPSPLAGSVRSPSAVPFPCPSPSRAGVGAVTAHLPGCLPSSGLIVAR